MMRIFYVFFLSAIFGSLAAADECVVKSPSTGVCSACPGEVADNQCVDLQYGACMTEAACEATLDPICYAMSGWGATAACKICPETNGVQNQCPSFGYTPCNTVCTSGTPGTDPTTVRPPVDPVTTPTRPQPVTNASRPTNPVASTTKAEASTGGDCVFARWDTGVCQTCPEPGTVDATGTFCKSMSWAPCFTSMAACQAAGNDGGGDNGGNGGSCASCPANGLSMNRPVWSGPSCYIANSSFPGFGPTWAPAGRTNFEKYIKSPDDIYKIAQWMNWGTQPVMSGTGHTGCEAAVIMYESIVCAIEYTLLSMRMFDYSAVGGSTRSVAEMFGSGDERTDLFEVLAFLAHTAKETGLYSAWVENSADYVDGTNAQYPPVAGQSYNGRGPIQISWNYNYGPFSEWLYGDKNVLLSNPDAVDPEGPGGWLAAIWFWMAPHDFSGNYVGGAGGTASPHDALTHWFDGKMSSVYGSNKYDKVVGMGLSTDIINGGIECTGNSAPNAQRVQYFLTFLNRLGYGKYMPDMSSSSACEADPACYGLFAGCGPSFAMPSYSNTTTNSCGVHYIPQ